MIRHTKYIVATVLLCSAIAFGGPSIIVYGNNSGGGTTGSGTGTLTTVCPPDGGDCFDILYTDAGNAFQFTPTSEVFPQGPLITTEPDAGGFVFGWPDGGVIFIAGRNSTDIVIQLLNSNSGTWLPITTGATFKTIVFAESTQFQNVNMSALVCSSGVSSGGFDSLTDATGKVTVSGAVAPSAGQVLTATSSTVGNWQAVGATKFAIPVGGGGAWAGTGTLSGGTVTIATTAVTASSLVFVTGTSFVVKSTNVADASTFNWLIVN